MPVTAKLSLTNELVEWGNDRRESFRVRWTRRIVVSCAS